MNFKQIVKVSFVSILLLGTTFIWANDTKATLPQSQVKEQKASDILLNAYRYIESLRHFQIKAINLSEDVYKDDVIVELRHKITMEVRRPGSMFVDIEGDVKNQEIYINQGRFVIYSKKYNMYGELEVDETIDDTLDMLFNMYNIKSPLANLVYSDISSRLRPKNDGYYIGVVDYKGVKCDYVVFTSDTKELQVWIQKGNKPLIRKFIIIDKTIKEKLRSTTMLDWNLHPFSFFDRFEFIAPKNAMKIDILPYKED